MENKDSLNNQFLADEDEELKVVDIKNAHVIRRQYFSHMKENIVTFKPNGIQFNTSCIMRFSDVTHVLLMIDWDKRWFIIKPCHPDDKDGQRWCNIKGEKHVTRFITGAPFSERLYKRLAWSKGNSYKVCGTLARQLDKEDELILVFELDDAEDYPMTKKSRKSAGVDDSELTAEALAALDEFEKQKELERVEREAAKAEGRETRRSKKRDHFPTGWGEELGVKYDDHQTRIEFPHLPENNQEAAKMGMSLFDNQQESEKHDE